MRRNLAFASNLRRECTTMALVHHRLTAAFGLTALRALANDADVRVRGMKFMQKHWLRVFLLAGMALAYALPSQADVIVGPVLRVVDGDTLLMQASDNLRQSVRIGWIDAPEAAQPYGRESRDTLARLVSGGTVRAECPKLDHRTSIVCKVWARPTDCASCERTIDVGLAQISGGMAWWHRRYALEQSAEDRKRYEAEEQVARQNRRGLWADENPTPPWEWRRAR